VLEVATPVLSAAATTDPNLVSLTTEARASRGGLRYLHTSPELAMKRLLASGSGDIYQICTVFRDGELGALHNPEFTLIEYYRLGMDHLTLMDEVDALLRWLMRGYRDLGEAERLTYAEAFRRHADIDPGDSAAAIAQVLRVRGEDVPARLAADRRALLDLAMSVLIAPRLGRGRPSFVYDFPADQAALARIRPGTRPVAERFELFLDGIELGNGFHELSCAAEQRARFAAELAARRAAGLEVVPVDERMLAALDAGLPDCAGVALGLERVLMRAAAVDDIAGVLAFGWDRA
jgi:lysyl-tRNA synthetase class 2